ncbi:hypothetical protein JOB18_021710 [Solea senegalensis]|uniref:RIIa domain-containing protein n=1 Tax=Solea senegalensis TaxID=28829 RepID=A0AAV6STD0_SOLSE|nr:hypothetical protein JOB18_021710 [Solea senegalensis]
MSNADDEFFTHKQRSLIECLLRAILLEQPENLQMFIQDYLSELTLFTSSSGTNMEDAIFEFEKMQEKSFFRNITRERLRMLEALSSAASPQVKDTDAKTKPKHVPAKKKTVAKTTETPKTKAPKPKAAGPEGTKALSKKAKDAEAKETKTPPKKPMTRPAGRKRTHPSKGKAPRPKSSGAMRKAFALQDKEPWVNVNKQPEKKKLRLSDLSKLKPHTALFSVVPRD